MIKVAKSAGFCFGVERAVNLAFSNAHLKNIVTLGPIIHNNAVINELQAKGVKAVNSINSDIDNVIIRSHGVGEDIYSDAVALGINIIDATCPYVKKIHKLVKENIKLGLSIIIIGDKEHPEIIGINGWAKNGAIIIKDEYDYNINLLDNKISYFVVAQTTYKEEVVNKVKEILLTKQIKFNYAHTICSATTKRQKEARILAKEMQAMIVIGSKHSSNTKKLFEVCRSECKNSFCIENISELTAIKFNENINIGVTAGASTPKNIIDDVIFYLNSTIKGGNNHGI